MRNAFRLRQARRISGADLVLVDDILTTGATSREISKVLKRDGQAGRILILTVARVPLPRESLGAATGAATFLSPIRGGQGGR